MNVLVIDTGLDIVGVYSVARRKYVPYRGDAIARALTRIEKADEVVTYNGDHRDLKDLLSFARRTRRNVGNAFPLRGKHTDMRTVCWSDRIWGSDLRTTYRIQFGELPTFPDTYEGSNEMDVHMTHGLWRAWKAGTLKIVDGCRV